MSIFRSIYHSSVAVAMIAALLTIISSCGPAVKTVDRKHYGYNTDTTIVVKKHLLGIFLDRNFPEYKNGINTDCKSAYGVTVQEAIDHYSKEKLKHYAYLSDKDNPANETSRLKKNHIITDSIHRTESDSIPVILKPSGSYENPEVYECISKQMTDTEQKGREQNVSMSAKPEILHARLVFRKGSSDIDVTAGDNLKEIEKIQFWINRCVTDESIAVDSVAVESSSSPEGSFRHNQNLSKERGNALVALLEKLNADAIKKADNTHPTIFADMLELTDIPENWATLEEKIAKDRVLTFEQKMDFIDICEIPDCDEREKHLYSKSYYPHIKNSIYPELRYASLYIRFHIADNNELHHKKSERKQG